MKNTVLKLSQRTWVIEVPGIPEPMPRVRATRRGNHAGVYTPNGAWKQWAQQVFLRCGGAPTPAHDGPVALDIEYRLPRPITLPKKFRAEGVYSWRRGDLDNFEKLILDQLTKRGWYTDDGRVAEVRHWKVYSDKPGATITIRHLDPGAKHG